MDRYLKTVLTIIALCLVSLNIYIWKPIKSNAHIGGQEFTNESFRNAIHNLIMRDCYVSSYTIRYNLSNKALVCEYNGAR